MYRKSRTLWLDGEKITAKRTDAGNWRFKLGSSQFVIDDRSGEVFELQPRPRAWFPVGRLDETRITLRPGATARRPGTPPSRSS